MNVDNVFVNPFAQEEQPPRLIFGADKLLSRRGNGYEIGAELVVSDRDVGSYEVKITPGASVTDVMLYAAWAAVRLSHADRLKQLKFSLQGALRTVVLGPKDVWGIDPTELTNEELASIQNIFDFEGGSAVEQRDDKQFAVHPDAYTSRLIGTVALTIFNRASS